ncbi:HlyD family secretion protein [Mucilaginibacter terrenus]|uniref:HlyD family secretion protein n=1 Tax=Mucilaginibacter terrenus TaxID=2482727 RepID=A0A3E2NSR3_9SPHI|nr:HlyD family secretion protein [Mucilaginibacter terrenus]RFZ84065.1 HlyD family secretion protein [Mucilaginibacter terrenus]
MNQEQRHSDDIEDIIYTPPRFIYRWGITSIMIVILTCLCLSAFIHFPSFLMSRIKFHGVKSLVNVRIPDSSVVTQILVVNGQVVNNKQLLAVVEHRGRKDSVFSSINGRVFYAGIVHEGALIDSSQLIFDLHPNTSYYGELEVPDQRMDEVSPGQKVIFKSLDGSEDIGSGVITYVTHDRLNPQKKIAEVEVLKLRKEFSSTIEDGVLADALITLSDRPLLAQIIENFGLGKR